MPMNSKLWQRIEGFDIDKSGDGLPFSARLAREQGWSPEQTRAAIEEYKRFLYLLCVAAAHLTPSEIVRQVWHRHLVDTRSYWTDFCERVLGRPIHDEPSDGATRAYHVLDGYADARSLYVDEFACEPPAEFWPPVSEHFAAEPSRQEIVRTSDWFVPKPSGYGSILWCVSAALLAVMASCGDVAAAVQPAAASSGSLWPMLVLAGVVGMARLVVRGLRRAPRDDPSKERATVGFGRGRGDGYWGCEG